MMKQHLYNFEGIQIPSKIYLKTIALEKILQNTTFQN